MPAATLWLGQMRFGCRSIFHRPSSATEAWRIKYSTCLTAQGYRHIASKQRSLRVRLRALSRIAELSQHEADGRKFQKREGVAVEIFPILGETTAPVEPCDGA